MGSPGRNQLVVGLASGAAATIMSLGAGSALSAPAATAACAPGYRPCLPVRGDVDCDQIGAALKPVRVTGADQYALDRDRDGVGCEVAGEGGGSRSPWGLILRKPPRKEATSAKAGDTLTVWGWSPASAKGAMFQLCAGSKCRNGARPLNGSTQTFGTWKVARSEVRGGVFKLALKVSRPRASDTVPIR